jgi:hypothetical protein
MQGLMICDGRAKKSKHCFNPYFFLSPSTMKTYALTGFFVNMDIVKFDPKPVSRFLYQCVFVF